ncbi:hypothetical protein SUDANB23_06636 (plasmid) [Streptomyces sp. enrichment culture]
MTWTLPEPVLSTPLPSPDLRPSFDNGATYTVEITGRAELLVIGRTEPRLSWDSTREESGKTPQQPRVPSH